MNIVITGCFNEEARGHHGRDEVKRTITAAGHRVRSEVTRNTDYLVVGTAMVAGHEPGPAKLAKADELGVPRITLSQLQALLAA